MEKSQKKWSLGNILFRKNKKQIPQADFSSDEDDIKAGFNDDFVQKSPLKVKTNKQFVNQKYGHQESVPDLEFHYFRPTHDQQQHLINRTPKIYANQNHIEYVNNHINIEKNRHLQPRNIYNNDVNQGSSQDEKSSYNSLSSPLNKAGSETGSRTSLNNKRTRTARNERYYQRIMRDDGRPLTIYGNVNTAEIQDYRPPLNVTSNRLSSSIKSSLCSSDLMLPIGQQSQSLPIPRYRCHSDYDKDDYENIFEVDEVESQPPPIPPRDPNRRFSINASISQQPYYFDHSLQKYVVFNTNGRCFSDDKINKNGTDFNHNRLVDINAPKHHELNFTKQQHDILRPRSRKPINLNTNLDNESVMNTGTDAVDNGQYILASQSKRSRSAADFVKLMHEPLGKKFAVRQRNLTSVEPIKFQLAQDTRNNDEALRKKYSSAEDVNVGKAKQSSVANIITPNSRKSFNPMDLKQKSSVSANLDDAINELELMYKSLVNNENFIERNEQRDLPTPTKFAVMMRKFEEYENEENRNDKEPDIVLDDVFSRNLKYANQKLKPSDPLPFGIPNTKLCPIPPKPSHDYLSVEPIQIRKSMIMMQNDPDVIADDLAVRNLRKDNPSYGRRRNLIEVDNQLVKRNHTLSTMSEHMHNEILKNSARPSGGKSEDYLQLELIKAKDERKSEPQKKRDAEFEDSLNALVMESKVIQQKLENDLTNLKREATSPSTRKTLVNLLDFRNVIEKEKEKKATSFENLSSAMKEPMKQKPTMTSTACSPIKQLESMTHVDDLVKSPPQKPQKAEKIENLIKMFNKNLSPEPVKKSTSFERSTRPSTTPERSIRQTATSAELLTKPKSPEKVSKNISNIQGILKKERILECSPKAITTSSTIVSPTRMNPRLVSPKVSTPVEVKKIDVESNINHIKQLIEQIKKTELNEKAGGVPLVSKTGGSDIPDYDNIKDDYEMTDGRLERITESSLMKLDSPKLPKAQLRREPSIEKATPEYSRGISSSSSCFRETSVETCSSKDSAKSDQYDEATAMYEDAINFSKESLKVRAPEPLKPQIVQATLKLEPNPSKKSEPSTAVIKIEVRKIIEQDHIPILKRQTSIEKLPELAREPTPHKRITPIIPPELLPQDNESLYNSMEELSMIFGIEKQPTPDVPMQAGKIVEDDFEAQFEKIVHDNEIADDIFLDENFKVSLIDLNNSTADNFDDVCINNEFCETSTECAMSLTEEKVLEDCKSDNNNNLTATDLSKLNEDHTNRLVTRRLQHATVYSLESENAKSSGTPLTLNNQADLKKRSIFLACIYCLMLYLQFMTLNFKSS